VLLVPASHPLWQLRLVTAWYDLRHTGAGPCTRFGRHARKQSVPSPSAARGTPGLAHPPVGRAAGSHAGLATLRRVRDTGACREVLPIVSDRSDAVPGARPAHLILV
jgi:hypothetical protein